MLSCGGTAARCAVTQRLGRVARRVVEQRDGNVLCGISIGEAGCGGTRV